MLIIISYFLVALEIIFAKSLKIEILFFILWVINLINAFYLFVRRIQKISSYYKMKVLDTNLLLIAIYFALLSVTIYTGYFAQNMGIFTWKNLYLKGEYCYFLQEEGFIKKTDIHKIPVNNTNTSNTWCELKDAYVFWKDSQNIYVCIIKNKYEYSFPIKREFILQEPLIVRKVFKPKRETQQTKSITKGGNKTPHQKVQSQNAIHS